MFVRARRLVRLIRMFGPLLGVLLASQGVSAQVRPPGAPTPVYSPPAVRPPPPPPVVPPPVVQAPVAHSPIAGSWDWMDGGVVSLLPDGTAQSTSVGAGRWYAEHKSGFVVEWPGGRERVRASDDGRQLFIKREHRGGGRFSANRRNEPLVGPWTWMGGPRVEMKSDCTAVGTHGDRGLWYVLSGGGVRHKYAIAWKSGYLDRIVLSHDLSRIEGKNQKGGVVTASRYVATPVVVPAVDPIVGQWSWFSNEVITIEPQGRLRNSSGGKGRWLLDPSKPGAYVLEWKAGWVDRLVLSPNGRRLHGTNQHGTLVSGTRMVAGGTVHHDPQQPVLLPDPMDDRDDRDPNHPRLPHRRAQRDCGTGDDPGCQVNRNGLYPMERNVFVALMNNMRSESNAFNRRDLLLPVVEKQALTSQQFTMILDLFDNELNRMEVATAVARRVVDPANALGYTSKFTNSFTRRDYSSLIASLM